MNDEVVKRLAAEVLEIFDASEVGLYEFPHIVRRRHVAVTESDLAAYCKAALDLLLEHGAVELIWQVWAIPGSERPATRADVDHGDPWAPIGPDPYLAVVSTQGRDSRIRLMMELDPP